MHIHDSENLQTMISVCLLEVLKENTIPFKAPKPASHISSQNSASTTCQRCYESGTWQWVSLTDSKLIQTALTPWRMALLCVSWYYSLCYKGRTSAFIIPFTILCLLMTHHSHKERLQCTGQGHAQKSCRPEEWLLLYLTYCSSG